MIGCRILLAVLFFLSAEAWLLTPLVFSGEPQEGSVAVRLYLTDGAIPKDDPMSSAWDSVQPSEFKLSPQVHWQDRIQEVTVKSVKVRGMHNGEDLAILLEYQDPTEDAADASGLEFMVGEKMAHFAHGQDMLQVEGGPVNIWYWKNENGKAIDMSAKGFKTLRVQDQQDVSATGAWQDGTWRVVFSRPIQTGDEQDAHIQPGKWVSVAFAVCDGVVGEDGGVKEKGSQKAVSSWWSIRAEPPPDNTIYGWVVFLIVIAAAFEMVLVRNLKKGQAA